MAICRSNTPVIDLSSLKELKNVQSLEFFDTKVTAEQLRELKQALPKCTIKVN